MRYKSRSRALAASALAASLGLAGLGLVAPAAGAAPAETDRIAGQDRYETAADIAAEALPNADTVVLTTGEKLPDALSANPIAGAEDAPILLTMKDSIPTSTQAQLDAIDPTNVIIVGGTAAVSDAVETALEADGYTVTREAGVDRFETAAEVARAVGDAPAIDADGAGSQTAMPTVALANGLTGLPDAVAASPMLHQEEIPLLLTGPDTLNEDAAAAIAELGAEQVLVLGGTAAISNAIEDELEGDDINVERLAGTDRWGTAAAIADFELDFLGFDAATTYIASGFSLADALAGGPLASVTNGPIVLVSETSVPAPTARWIEEHAADIDEIIALGGTAVINDTVLAEAAALADEGTQPNQDFTISPATGSNTVASPATGTQTAQQFFTVTGLDNAKFYDVRLFACDDVTTTDGTTSFRDDDNTVGDTTVLEGNNVADDTNTTDTGAAGITSVNNNGALTLGDNVSPVNGTITFSVNSQQADCAVAVVFEDTPDNDVLELDANNQPISAFVNTGDLVFTARPATTGPANGVTVTSADEANNQFTTDSTDAGTAPDATFLYDANDSFNLPGLTGASLAQFEAALTTGDVLNVQYNADPAGVSTFTIVTNTTPAPTNVVASVTNADGDATANDVVITFTPGTDTPAGTSYVVNRYTVAPAANGTCPAPTALNTTPAGTVTDANSTDTTATDEDRAVGCYAYTVTATSPNGGTAVTSATFSNAVRVAAPAPTNPPTITDAQLVTDDVLIGAVDDQDVVSATFSEPVFQPGQTSGDADALALIDLTDPDGDLIRVRCGYDGGADPTTASTGYMSTSDGITEASCVAGATPNSYTITLLQPAEDRNVAGNSTASVRNISYPLTIVAIQNVVDADGNPVNLAGSADKVVDDETP